MQLAQYPQDLIDRVLWQRGRHHAFPTLNAAATALLVVDMQNAFVSPQSPFACPRSRAVVPVINELAHGVRDSGGHIVWIKSTYGPHPSNDWPVFFDHILGPEVSRQFRASLMSDAEGHALWPDMHYVPEDSILEKNRFSAFIGSRGRLESLLRERGLDTVLVAGTVTNVCCESTAREAAMLNFKTIMVSDANAGRSDAEDLQTFATVLRVFGDVTSSREVMERLARRPCP